MATEPRFYKKNYDVISLPCEYKGYKGDMRYAIITDLSEDELNALYSDELEKYRPFVIITREMRLAMRIYDRNENKHRMRRARGESLLKDELDYRVIPNIALSTALDIITDYLCSICNKYCLIYLHILSSHFLRYW